MIHQFAATQILARHITAVHSPDPVSVMDSRTSEPTLAASKALAGKTAKSMRTDVPYVKSCYAARSRFTLPSTGNPGGKGPGHVHDWRGLGLTGF